MKNKIKKDLQQDCIELDFIFSVLMESNCNDFRAKKFNEHRILQLIQFHRVEALFYSKIKGENFVSFEFEIKLEQLCNRNQIQKLNLIELFFSIVRDLNHAGIPILAFKGPILSYKLYNDFTKRTYRDCDFRIPLEHIDAVIEIFKNRGFNLIDSNFNSTMQKEYFFKVKNHISFVNTDNIIFEVHVFISPFLQNKKMFLKSEEWKEIKFGNVKLFVLDDVDEFIYLCFHGLRNFFFRFSWILDIHAYLNQRDEFFLKSVMARAKFYNCSNFIEETLNVLHFYLKEDYKDTSFIHLMKSNNIIQFGHLENGQKIKWHKKVRLYYKLVYVLFGFKGVFYEFKMRRIKPQNWTFFVFRDYIFGLNQIFSELIWIVSKLNKKNG